MDGRRRELTDRARRRGGLLVSADFTELGYASNQPSRMVRRGELVELQPRVFLVAGVPDSREVRVRAAALAAGPRAALSHATAAELLDLRHVPVALTRNRIDITFPRGYRPAVRGAQLHRPLFLPEDHVLVRGDLRLTTLERTLVDLGNVLRPGTYQRVVDAVLADQRSDVDRVWAVSDELGAYPGVRLVRATLARFDARMIGSRTDLERAFFRGLRTRGVDLPTANVPIVDLDGRRRFFDFAYIPERLPIEIDSDRHHASLIGRASDGARQNAIVLTGEWRAPLRFDERDVFERMDRVACEVQRGLDLARRSPLVVAYPSGTK